MDTELKMVNSQGFTALMFASFNNNAKCVKALLKEAGMTAFSGLPALFIAAIRDN